MTELASGGALETAAWKVKNLDDYDARLERAARRVDELARAHETAALVIYEAALMKSGRPIEEVRRLVREFEETFEDEEEELTIPRVSSIMNVEGDEWFFGDEALRVMTGQLLGQFQHRVAQYNYVNEREVLRRWADGYDTRLFIRRGIYETEPVVGVVSGFDLPLVQYLRVIAGGDTVAPDEEISQALVALDVLDEEVVKDADQGTGGTDQESVEPSPDDRADRRDARARADRGEEPARVQDPQAKDAPGVLEEEGGEK